MPKSNSNTSHSFFGCLPALSAAVLLAGCVETTVKPAAVSFDEPQDAEPVDDSALYGQRAADAAPELEQFGRLAGRWDCRVEERSRELDWLPRSGSVVWTWFYTLGGYAVQDVWSPEAGSGRPFGTNLRIFDAERGAWKSVWTGSDRTDFEYWQGAEAGGEIVMQTGRQGPRARIVFSSMTANTFDWRFERVIDRSWEGVLRASCTRLGRLR